MKSATKSPIKPRVKKPKVSFNVEEHEGYDEVDMAAVKDGEPLPIVEVKPFVTKVWHREKSLANGWDKSAAFTERPDVISRAENHLRDLELSGDILPEDVTPLSSQRATPSSPVLSHRALNFYVNSFDDYKNQKDYMRGVSESEIKKKQKLHPLADTKNKKQLEHSESIIPGFITRDDRAKTTFNEITEADLQSRAYSCSPKSITPLEYQKRQQIRIGGSSPLNISRHTPSLKGTPTPTPRGINNAFPIPSIRHGSPASQLNSKRVKKDRNRYANRSPIYDHIDRAGALPSLKINATSLRKRASLDGDSEGFSECCPMDRSRVGGIENSLVLLSRHGSPTKVEQQLTGELERNLHRFRRSKDYSPFEVNPAELAKYYSSPAFNMTAGEACIRDALQSNASKRRQKKPRIYEKDSKMLSSLRNEHAHNVMLRREAHIESFDNGYIQDLCDGPRMAFGEDMFDRPATPDDLIVPYDTPRSRMDSRMYCPPEAPSRVQSEPPTGLDANGIDSPLAYRISTQSTTAAARKPLESYSKMSLRQQQKAKAVFEKHAVSTVSQTVSQRPQTRAAPVKPHSESNGILTSASRVSKRIDSERVGHTPVGLPTHVSSSKADSDISGRTFITSDSMHQVAPVKG